MNDKDQTFATSKESTRKDVERMFGVLRSKFRIIQNSCRVLSTEKPSGQFLGLIVISH
jgi:hypothetical protein